MPYISDNGGLSDTINQAGDRIRGSLNAGYAEKEKQAEQNRVLHPVTQKWLQKVVSGEMSPADAAMAAHAEHDQLGTPGGAVASQPGSAGAYQMDAARNQDTQAASMNQGMTKPFTARDAADLEGVGKMASNSASTRANLAYAKNMGTSQVQTLKNEGSKYRTDAKYTDSGANRDERGREFDAKIAQDKTKMDQADMRIRELAKNKDQALRDGKMDKTSLELYKADAKEVIDLRKSIRGLMANKIAAVGTGGWKDKDPITGEPTKQALEYNAKIEELNLKLDELEKIQHSSTQSMGGRQSAVAPPGTSIPPPGAGPAFMPNQLPGADQGGPNNGPVPQGAGQNVGPSVPPPIPTDVPVQEPAQEPAQQPLPDPNVLPERRGASAGQPEPDSTITIRVKNKKTGQIVDIPSNKVKAAQAAPGFKTKYVVLD